MNGRSHMIIGTAASLLLLPKMGYEFNLLTSTAAALGSLIPDIDHPKALINQKLLFNKNKEGKILFYCTSGGIFLYKGFESFSKSMMFLGILLILIGLSKHRTFTHSLGGVLVISYYIFFLFNEQMIMDNITYATIIGVVSHLVCDFFTKEGVEMFYPLSHKKYRFPFTITTGSVAESAINLIFIFIIFNETIIK
ncbi:metal-dependent hydrolase [Anaeromicrobium sediminis]|uniref:Metal-dependent hydrolase n=1 Tax=Anaeromicrobium sediminis TaxID=1478221 RepID=A0A267MBH4_9FIRM|nr:metal-dependent hydrolase [Anaeromicrobium sediminis]PAB56896.1 hypothetical protein CCE28_19985 [Anaeromicrobium sediminis]